MSDMRADLLLEFLESAIHTVLYARNIYPPEVFERRRKYQVPVWMSRYPQLNEYVHKVLENSRPLVLKDLLAQAVVCFKAESGEVVENIVFKLEAGDAQPFAEISQDTLEELEASFRSVLLKLNITTGTLPSRKGCTFTLCMVCKEQSRDQLAKVCSDLCSTWAFTDQSLALIRQPRVVPIRSMIIKPLVLQVYSCVPVS